MLYKILEDAFGIERNLVDKMLDIEKLLVDRFGEIDQIKQYNQYKVLNAMQEARLSDQHFNWTTGYGFNDIGREKIEEIYARVFSAEDAIVRPTIANGTHALSLCLSGLLHSGDEIISVTGEPYDTLNELIGLKGEYRGSLKNIGVIYKQIDFMDDGTVDFDAIGKEITEKTTMVYIQRSTGYSFRPAVDINTIEKIVEIAKKKNNKAVCMIDNCYGEFLEEKEPTDVGADLLAGSLIKNPGGGIVLTGGYIVGKRDLIEEISYKLTSPGIGKECGLTFGLSRQMFQGLFLAPHIVGEAIKGSIFCAKLFEEMGYEVKPKYDAARSDIIQLIRLGSAEKVIAFCKGIQEAAPVDSFVSPEPWPMPGYDDPVIMAAGAFVQGSSIELSADAPIREPYIVYYQGGLTYEHAKLGTLLALKNINKFDQEIRRQTYKI